LKHTRERSNVLLARKLANWRLTREFAECRRKLDSRARNSNA
jgi:hypothetical protein